MFLGKETCDRLRCGRCTLALGKPPQLWRGSEWRKRIRRLDTTIAPSRFMASQLRNFLGLDTQVVPNFAPRPGTKGETDRGAPYMVFAGVLEPSKGLDIILEAFGEDLGVDLRIFGKGSLERAARRKEQESGGRVRYFGQLDQEMLRPHVQGATGLFALTTINENCPLSALEAMALGVPLIVNSRGGLPELVQEPSSGITTELEVKRLRKAITELSTNPGLRDRLSRNALSAYEEKYTPAAYLSRYLEIAGGLGGKSQ